MENTEFRIHWLSFTVHATSEDAIYLYDNLFKDTFGPLQPLGNGGRGFKEILIGLAAFKVYLHPVNANASYFHFEIPGEACDALRWEYYFGLIYYLQSNFPGKYEFKRVDLAFDHVPFSPQEVDQAIRAEKIRSLAKRESLTVYDTPFKAREDGELGCCTVEFGSRASDRMVRVYNKRGYTRVELQAKDDRAHFICMQLLNIQNIDYWFPVMISHLRDFLDIETDWWEEFIHGYGRAYLTISKPREIELDRIKKWINQQVAPSLSLFVDCSEPEDFQAMVKSGRKRRNPRLEGLARYPNYGKGTP